MICVLEARLDGHDTEQGKQLAAVEAVEARMGRALDELERRLSSESTARSHLELKTADTAAFLATHRQTLSKYQDACDERCDQLGQEVCPAGPGAPAMALWTMTGLPADSFKLFARARAHSLPPIRGVVANMLSDISVIPDGLQSSVPLDIVCRC